MAEIHNDDGFPIPIEWHFPEGSISRYATTLTIQFGEHECSLSFFELRPPVLLGTQKEIEEQVKGIKSVRAECVSRVIVANSRMPEFVKVINNALEIQAAKQAKIQGKSE